MASATDVALTVTGLGTAAVQVAVTVGAGVAERWTEGSLAVQFEVTNAEAFAEHTPVPVNRFVAANCWLFAGAAAVWWIVTVSGVTFNAVTVQLLLAPPQPATVMNAAQNGTTANILGENIGGSSFAAARILIFCCRSAHSATFMEREANAVLHA
ncbi:MAG TPA: hypothetical protein VFY05_14085 [Candidatus Angelobacter sp.]|nr:hypothetical protein [Candidatus Angelobacter sp.]